MRFVRCASLLTLVFAVCAVSADDKKMDMEAIGKKMQKHGELVDEHKVLNSFAGDWTYTGKMWMDPNSDPTPIAGTSNNKLLYGGKVLSMVVKGNDPNFPFEGQGWWGYDKSKKKHVFAWVDSMNGVVVNGEGTWDKSKNTLTWESECYCPIREKKMRMRELIEIRPDGTIHSTSWSRDGGKDVKEMEMHYTRAK